MDTPTEDEDKDNVYLFAFDLRKGEVVENLSKEDAWEYRIRYNYHANGNYATIGDGIRHEVILNNNHWDRLLKIIKNDELDKSGLDFIMDGYLDYGFPNDESKETFISAVKSGIIKPLAEYNSK